MRTRDLGTLWHALVGAGAYALLDAIPVDIPSLVILALLAVLGWVREVVQHDWMLSPRQWVEALAWVAGGAVAWWIMR